MIGIDYALVVPNENLSLAEGAVKVFQSKSYASCQRDLLKYARRRRIDTRVAWRQLPAEERQWVIEGDDGASFDNGLWYGITRFFDWLESRAYRMHVRVLLSKYRNYTPCEVCGGARLQAEALLWRVGTKQQADDVVAPAQRFMPRGAALTPARLQALPGLHLHDVMSMPIAECGRFFETLTLAGAMDEAAVVLLDEIRSRLRFLGRVGLGYLALDRQSRTLSGGEVQRINLTTALGTSLTNALFVLDEPSIGLHARDMARVSDVLHRLRDAGNTLLVVEHDDQVMRSADRIIDIGPGPGRAGGAVVFEGTPGAIMRDKQSLTGRYLSGPRRGVRAGPALPGRGASHHGTRRA